MNINIIIDASLPIDRIESFEKWNFKRFYRSKCLVTCFSNLKSHDSRSRTNAFLCLLLLVRYTWCHCVTANGFSIHYQKPCKTLFNCQPLFAIMFAKSLCEIIASRFFQVESPRRVITRELHRFYWRITAFPGLEQKIESERKAFRVAAFFEISGNVPSIRRNCLSPFEGQGRQAFPKEHLKSNFPTFMTCSRHFFPLWVFVNSNNDSLQLK